MQNTEPKYTTNILNILLLLISFLAINNSYAQWRQSSGVIRQPTGTHIYNPGVSAIAAIDNNIYAGTTYDGVFQTTDNGATWKTVNSGYKEYDVLSLLTSGANIFVAIGGDGLFRSQDKAQSWSRTMGTVSSTGPLEPWVWTLTESSSSIFAGTVKGVYRSINSGNSWAKLSDSGRTNLGSKTIRANGKYLFDGAGSSLYRLPLGGTRWTQIGSMNNIMSLAILTNYIYVAAADGVSRSENDGASWYQVNNGLTSMPTCLIGNGTNIYAGTYLDGIYFSSNYGETWSQVGLRGTKVKTLAIVGTNIYAGSDSTIWMRPLLEITNINNSTNLVSNSAFRY